MVSQAENQMLTRRLAPLIVAFVVLMPGRPSADDKPYAPFTTDIATVESGAFGKSGSGGAGTARSCAAGARRSTATTSSSSNGLSTERTKTKGDRDEVYP